MNIEQLGPDNIKVDLRPVDLDRYDLDYLSISTDSPGTKLMLKDILYEAGELTGFSTKNCKLLIDVIPGKRDGCILYLTKIPKEQNMRKKIITLEPEIEKPGNSYILSCNCIDDTINAINRFAFYPDISLAKSSLYNLCGKYYLTFSPTRFGLDKARLCSLLAALSEYGETQPATPIREAMLCEHGSTIKENRAIESFMRYFI